MEVFTDIDEGNFLKYHMFLRPTGTSTGFERSIAVSSEWAQRLTAIYSVFVTLLLVFCWEIVSIAVISKSGSIKESRKALDKPRDKVSPHNRPPCPPDDILSGIAFVGFWNAREPLVATTFIIGYISRLIFKRSSDPKRPTIPWQTYPLFLLALLWLVGTYAASVLVAAELVSGNVAPANPKRVYIPQPPGTDPMDLMRLQAVRAPAALRSLGSAEASGTEHTIRKRFLFESHLASGASQQYFTYNYTVTAHDLGLQKWYDLKQVVSGRCNVNDTWFSGTVTGEDLDVYNPWRLSNTTVHVVFDGERKTAPYATALAFPYKNKDFMEHQAVEHRYGIIAHSSHRASHSGSTDPWYRTETFTPRDNETDARTKDYPGNRVMGGRPALSCTQKDEWSYNGRKFKNIYELTREPSMKFPGGWATQLQLDFAHPRIIEVINSAGSSSLTSSSTFVGGRFDAASATIQTDMKRLFTATWISTAHTFRNMIMTGPGQGIENGASQANEQPEKGVGLFVVSTPKVATLRFSVLVSVPVLLLSSMLALSILKLWLWCTHRNKNIRFADGAHLFPRAQVPATFNETEGLFGIIKKCKKQSGNFAGWTISEAKEGSLRPDPEQPGEG